MNLHDLAKQKEKLAPGHRLCAGCAAPIIARMVLHAVQDMNVVVANATGCLEVSTTIYPYTSWKVPWIHNAFENAAATLSGVEAAYKSLKKQGKLKKEIKFVAFGGDGGTYDIGLQSLSGSLERGHNFVYVCYDNEAYMNTGIQRSGATPYGAHTNTSPAGKVHPGKEQWRKDLTTIVAAHHIKYVGQSTVAHWQDLIEKAKKAFSVEGPAFLNILSPCIPGWGYLPEDTIEIAKLAVDTRFWPLIEFENEKWVLNKDVPKPKPITEWLKSQSRYRHLFKPENKHIIEKIQKRVDSEWERIKKLTTA